MSIDKGSDHFELRRDIDVETEKPRIEIYSKKQQTKTNEKKLNSIACEVLPGNKTSIDSLKEKLMTLFSWKWVKLDTNTLINIKSVAKSTGLTPKEIREFSKTGELSKKIIDKLTENEKVEAINSRIALYKLNPVSKANAELIERKTGLKEGEVKQTNIYWNPNERSILVGESEQEAYMYRTQLTNTYWFTADIYLEEGIYYINLKRESGIHIEAREFRDDLLATWTGDASPEELDKQYAETLSFVTGNEVSRVEDKDMDMPKELEPRSFGFKAISGFDLKPDKSGYNIADNKDYDPGSDFRMAKVELDAALKRGGKIKGETLKLAAQEYKIHLMPKNENMQMILERLQNKLREDPELRKHVAQYKARVGIENEGKVMLPKDTGEVFPSIVIYAENKEAAQAILDAVYKLYPEADEFGEGREPRFNRKINELIYYAQGSGDIKNNAEKAGLADQLFEEDKIHFRERYPGEYSLNDPDHPSLSSRQPAGEFSYKDITVPKPEERKT